MADAPGRVLVTGCGGYLANAVLPHLRASWPRARLAGVGRHTTRLQDWDALHEAELCDTDAMAALLTDLQPDVVLHAAGRLAGEDWSLLYRDNVQSTLSLLAAVRRSAPSARTVVVGSAAECGMVPPDELPVREHHPLRPVSPYGVSKSWQRLAALSQSWHGVHVCVARLFNIVGPCMPGTTSLGAFARQLRDIAAGTRPPILDVGDLSPRRDFLDVADIGSAFVALATGGRSGELYNVCRGSSVSIAQALNTMIAASGLAVQLHTDSTRLRAGDVPDVYGDASKLVSASGWTPAVALDDSLRALVASVT